ncbi:hypothetical protein AMK16_02990 [Streptomyces sp. CB00455]|uniref:hypothetical protein n=1 Tax=Streptomyces sp. CB00455 TaxID=1703927 RepID=UPI00093CBE0C|nr:hypothetical protein [Streptomyces sp. CB00455]OKK22172.1 hypothetical protein AMK16_02990 [Streptomyces sp. CB00455]
MTLLSDQADDIRALVGSTDPGAVWAVGGPEGIQARSHPGGGGGAGATRVAGGAGGAVGAGCPESGADAVHDVGALGAVLALWPAIGNLVEEGALRLHTPLAAYGEEAAAGTPAGATAHHLLTRSDGADALTRLAEHLSGCPLAELATTRVWHPLGMTGTRFADGTLHAPLGDLVLFLRHLLRTAAPEGATPPTGPAPEGLPVPAAPAGPVSPAAPVGSPAAPVGPLGSAVPAVPVGSAGPVDGGGPALLLAQGPAAAAAAAAGPVVPTGITRAWTTESLRIRTGELIPARGLLWHPAPYGVWAHSAPAPGGPALWVSPRHRRWAVLLPTAGSARLRTAFRDAAFAPSPH